MSERKILKNHPVTSSEIDDLRVKIGWKSVKTKLDIGLAHTYASFSIRENTQLIGFCRVISDGSLYAFIVDLLIDPEKQSQGLGSTLLQEVIQALKSDGIRLIQLTFDPKLEAFYQKNGFTIIKAGTILND